MTIKPAGNLVTLLEPDSAAAEAFRILRTNISLRDFDQSLKVINIISASAQESKSTTILNLAYTYGNLGKKVLLMDLDLRLPSLHKKLRLKNKTGVSEVVSKTASISESIIHYTNQMDILLAGAKNPYASEMIQSANFKNLLDNLKQVYDMIFIDCPPINLVTDGMIASTLCDGTILCIASGKDDDKELLKCKEMLNQFNVNVLGIVMTRMPISKKYYSDYNYGGYTSDKKKKGK